jgi:hypothetical protein
VFKVIFSLKVSFCEFEPLIYMIDLVPLMVQTMWFHALVHKSYGTIGKDGVINETGVPPPFVITGKIFPPELMSNAIVLFSVENCDVESVK